MGLRERLRHEACEHLTENVAPARSQVCEGCGSTSNLRVCVDCGFVGCCESQLGHNREHALSAGHPVIKSLPLQAGSFTWCYECGRYV